MLKSVGGLGHINGGNSADSGCAVGSLESNAGALGWGDNGEKLKHVGY